MSSLTAAVAAFQQRRGLAAGVVTAGFAAASALLAPLVAAALRHGFSAPAVDYSQLGDSLQSQLLAPAIRRRALRLSLHLHLAIPLVARLGACCSIDLAPRRRPLPSVCLLPRLSDLLAQKCRTGWYCCRRSPSASGFLLASFSMPPIRSAISERQALARSNLGCFLPIESPRSLVLRLADFNMDCLDRRKLRC